MYNRDYKPKPKFFNIVYEPQIGWNCSLVDVLIDCTSQVKIGDNVAFGHGVKLLCAKHDYSKRGQDRMIISISKPITVENGAWIASGAIICGGVTIGENSVVAAGAVVLESVPPNTMVGGIPAKYIKDI